MKKWYYKVSEVGGSVIILLGLTFLFTTKKKEPKKELEESQSFLHSMQEQEDSITNSIN